VEQALMQATVMAKQLEIDGESSAPRECTDLSAVGEFHRQVMPIMQGGNPAQAQRLLKHQMEQGKSSLKQTYAMVAYEVALVNRSLSQHPGVRPVWAAACERVVERVNHARGATSAHDLELARRIPLPPSPPPSPTIPARIS
jgi:hypothetical protein